MSDQADLNPADAIATAIATLRAAFPAGFRIDAEGVVTEEQPSKAEPVDFLKLMEISQETRKMQVELAAGKTVEFEIRGLRSTEQARLEQFIITPPKKKVKNPKGGPDVEEDDLDNPAFVKASIEAARKRRALVISMGMTGAKEAIAQKVGPEATVEQITGWLEESFTPRVLDAIYGGIQHLTSAPIQHASFI